MTASRSQTPDLMLVQAMAQGDMAALEELYARYSVYLLNYIHGRVSDSVLAEEILQNVMWSVWKAASNFRGDSQVRTWLIAIARNHCINTYRKRRVDVVALDESRAGDDTGPMEQVIRDSERDEVRMALLELPDDQRETLELVFYHGLTGPEVADLMDVSVGTVKSRLHRAKAALRDVLTQEANYE